MGELGGDEEGNRHFLLLMFCWPQRRSIYGHIKGNHQTIGELQPMSVDIPVVFSRKE